MSKTMWVVVSRQRQDQVPDLFISSALASPRGNPKLIWNILPRKYNRNKWICLSEEERGQGREMRSWGKDSGRQLTAVEKELCAKH